MPALRQVVCTLRPLEQARCCTQLQVGEELTLFFVIKVQKFCKGDVAAVIALTRSLHLRVQADNGTGLSLRFVSWIHILPHF